MVSIVYPNTPAPADLSGFERGLSALAEGLEERRAKKALDMFADSLYGGQQPMSLSALAPQDNKVTRSPLPPVDQPSRMVSQAHTASGPNPPVGAIEAYIRHAAKQRGIDPDTAVKVAMSEGGVSDPTRQSDVVKDGVREQSYGPFQLFMNGGLGNEALAAGVDPRTDWKGGINFALDKAKEGGWGPWYGAAKVGVGERDGLDGPQGTVEAFDGTQPSQVAQSVPAASGGSLLPPPDVMRALLRNKSTRQFGAQIAQEAMKARRGDPEAALRLEKARLELEKLRNPKPDLINAGDGRLYDPVSQQWITAPGGNTDASQRAASAAEFGLTPDDPAYRSYVLTGKMPREDQAPLTATDKKAILEADEMVQANESTIQLLQSVLAPGEGGVSLNDRAGSGAMAGTQSWLARNDPTGMFDDAKGEATTELQNVVLNQALSNLKATFGAAPTEGERKILVDLQASIDKTPAERKVIIDRAIAAAERRLTFNQQRVDELRGGSFYKPGGGKSATSKGNRTSSGVQWSVEE